METDPRLKGCTALRLINSIFLCVMFLMASATGDDAVYRRLTMTDNNDETGMRDCLKRAAAAVSQEDLDAYISCFTDGQRKQMRRTAALLFVRHTMSLELLDCHLVEQADAHATWVIKYHALLTGVGYDVVSLLHMQKENDTWRISREQVETSEKSKLVAKPDAVVPVGCAGGQCRLVPQ